MKRKILQNLTLLFLLTAGAVILTSCGGKRSAIGNEDEIIVLADSMEYDALKEILHNVFADTIYTPQPEELFILNRKGIGSLKKYQNRKNIIITAPLISGSNTSRYINSVLDSTVRNMVNEGKEFVFNKYDLWAKNQLVMFLTAPETEDLIEKIGNNKKQLIQYFQKISDQRLFKSLYNAKFEQKKIEAQFLRDYSWIIYVQADFLVGKNSPEDNFVWLRRAPGTDMERWLFIHWIENASPSFLEVDSVYAERNRMTEKFLRSSDDKAYVEISDDIITTSEVNFKDRYALMTQGLWRMNDKSMGGPFINYTFYDEDTGRIYMLDGSVYAPRYYKKKLIQQVDVLLKSFYTESELSEDKINDLLSELD